MQDETGFLDAIAQTPEDLEIREIYADWLEDRDDPRADYLRLRCEFLKVTDQDHRADLLQRAIDSAKPIELEWLRFIDLHDVLCQVTRRCGGPLPLALRVLWREVVWQSDSREPRAFYPSIDTGGCWDEVFLSSDGNLEQNIFLERNPERREAFQAMFKQIDFLGTYSDRGDTFGFWRYADDIRPTDAPIVSLDIGCEFALGGRTLQDFFAVPAHYRLRRAGDSTIADWDSDERAEFAAARDWFAERGISTSATLEEASLATNGFPDPQERFERYCR